MSRYYSISQVLAEAISEAELDGGMTIKQCLRLMGDKSILLGLLLFSLVNAVPLGIPILSTITGIPIVILGTQLLLCPNRFWLPQKVACYHLHRGKALTSLKRLLPRIQRLEQYLRPRITMLSEPPIRNLLGLIFVSMGLLLALPIPFTNFPAGLSLSILAIGLITRDGLVVLVGIFMALLAATAVLMTLDFVGTSLQALLG